MCLTCTANVRTPLKLAPGRLSLSGEKLNLSSGIASAASRTCFSIALISRSMAEARVGVEGEACGAVVWVDWPRALMARMSVAAKIRSEFIDGLLGGQGL